MATIRAFETPWAPGFRSAFARFLFIGGMFVIVIALLLAVVVLRPGDDACPPGVPDPCLDPDPRMALRQWIGIGGSLLGGLATLASLRLGRTGARVGGVGPG